MEIVQSLALSKRSLLIREHAKKFKPEDMEISIEGKNCIVTGANSGIGYATAEGLASRYICLYCLNYITGRTAFYNLDELALLSVMVLETTCCLSSIYVLFLSVGQLYT